MSNATDDNDLDTLLSKAAESFIKIFEVYGLAILSGDNTQQHSHDLKSVLDHFVANKDRVLMQAVMATQSNTQVTLGDPQTASTSRSLLTARKRAKLNNKGPIKSCDGCIDANNKLKQVKAQLIEERRERQSLTKLLDDTRHKLVQFKDEHNKAMTAVVNVLKADLVTKDECDL